MTDGGRSSGLFYWVVIIEELFPPDFLLFLEKKDRKREKNTGNVSLSEDI